MTSLFDRHAEHLKPLCRYREFIGEETRRKWEWQCRHEAEDAFWTSVVNGIIGKTFPLSTMACLQVSLPETFQRLAMKAQWCYLAWQVCQLLS